MIHLVPPSTRCVSCSTGWGERTREGETDLAEMQDSVVIEKTALSYCQMDEPPGVRPPRRPSPPLSRRRVLRTVRKQDLLLSSTTSSASCSRRRGVGRFSPHALCGLVYHSPRWPTIWGELLGAHHVDQAPHHDPCRRLLCPPTTTTYPAPFTTFTHSTRPRASPADRRRSASTRPVDPLASTDEQTFRRPRSLANSNYQLARPGGREVLP